jgi:hypothetical protein
MNSKLQVVKTVTGVNYSSLGLCQCFKIDLLNHVIGGGDDYGRRASTLNTGTKTNVPAEYPDAKRILGSFVNERNRKVIRNCSRASRAEISEHRQKSGQAARNQKQMATAQWLRHKSHRRLRG